MTVNETLLRFFFVNSNYEAFNRQVLRLKFRGILNENRRKYFATFRHGNGLKIYIYKYFNFSLRHRVQICTGAHPASYPTGTGGSFSGGKAAGA
jgi:hypothetical protein